MNPMRSELSCQRTPASMTGCAWPPTTSTRACAASGPRKRLEIHNLGLGIEALDADLVFLQEVRLHHTPRGAPASTAPGSAGPTAAQAEFLAPEGYEVGLPHQRRHAPRRTRQRAAVALAARRHRPPRRQRPPLRAARPAARAGAVARPHGARGGGAPRPDARAAACARCSAWPTSSPPRCRPARRCSSPATSTTGAKGWTRRCARSAWRARSATVPRAVRRSTFPSRVPVFSLDRIYTRGLTCRSTFVPRGAAWARM